MRIPTFEDSVIRLEKISSMIYATAFLLVLAVIGVSFYLAFWVVFISITFSFLPVAITTGPYIETVLTVVILGTALPYFIDFITLGWLKRFSFYSKIYGPIYSFMGFLTLAPFYRGIYYGLVSNLKRRFILLGTFIFIVVTLFITILLRGESVLNQSKMISTATGFTLFDGYYRDLNPDKPSRWATIQSSEVDNGIIKLILSHKAAYEDHIAMNCDYEARLSANEESKSVILLDCLSQNFRIEIDSTVILPERWFFADSPSSNQRGIATWIRADTISNGVHQLNVFVIVGSQNKRLMASIPFYNLSGNSFTKSKTIDFPEANKAEKQDSIPNINLPLEQDL